MTYNIPMQNEREMIQKSVAAWRRAEPTLERVRRENIRTTDTASAIAAFSGMALAAAKKHPPKSTSGLVEQQRIFMKIAAATQ